MTQTPNWGRLPHGLRERHQWLMASPDTAGDLKVPTSITPDGRLIHGSSTDRSTWLSFEYAASVALQHGYGIGYVLAGDDPFICVDLDVRDGRKYPDQPEKWTTQQELQRYWLITQSFDTYTELSQSGKGLHIWCMGSAAPGAKYGGVEVYSQERFIVCTGNALQGYDKPIYERQSWVDLLVSEIRAKQGANKKASELVEVDAIYTDEEILERARTADNAVKFIALFEGRWVEYGFPSQSEADLALLSMFTFYSRSDEQCRRLFRRSALGQREKAAEDDRYLDRTLKVIRGRQAEEDAAEARRVEASRAYIASMQTNRSAIQEYAASLGPANAAAAVHAAAGAEDPGSALPAPAASYTPPPVQAGEHGLGWPPGFVGALAGYIYRSAPRPVKEVAIVAALGWIAGVCGKMWNIPGSGLNIYLILVARSAVGKEAMHSGLSSLTGKLCEAVPSAGEFVDFTDFASGPALVKACANNASFVNVAGEWGRKLRRIAQDSERDGPMQQLRTVMTNLYQKSGPAAIVGGLTYSNKENNIASVSGVAYSMIGETTPGTFYDSLTETMMEDGFLSRFTIVEYTGERPPANHSPQTVPDQPLVDRCIDLVIQSKTLMQNKSHPVGVSRDEEAAAMMIAFDKECDAEINKTTDESWRQMWNRASLKMMRIAALLAVGDNSLQPCITAEHCKWALDLIRRDITIMKRRVESGDVGTGDGVRERKLVMLIKEYFDNPIGLGYKIPAGLREAGIIPRSFLQIRTSRLSAFTTHRNGSTKALDEALRSLCDSGHLMEVDKTKLFDAYGTSGKAYRPLSLPDYGAGHAK